MNSHDETASPGDARAVAPDPSTSVLMQDKVDRAQRFVVALTALLAAGANLLIFLEKQWLVAALTILLGVLGAAFYVAARNKRKPNVEEALFTRVAARGVLVAVALFTIAAALIVTVTPRLYERGTIFAVARFVGPPLPSPYGDCRPSDRLAQTLADVGHDYQNVSAFELPYAIDPGGRWAGMLARWHGFLQGADTVIYGEYSFADDGTGSPDRLLITPKTDSVPAIPLGTKTAPLMSWHFPNRLVRIDELCTGRSQRFLNDGRRLILALAGLQMFASQRYLAAEQALRDAKSTRFGDADTPSRPVDDPHSHCNDPEDLQSECSGELAFYTAVLDKHFGHFEEAIKEFDFATLHLMRPAPYINLGEMYVARNKGSRALEAFKNAVATDPTSIAAWASLAQYRAEYGDAADGPAATFELDRARALAERQGGSAADSYGIIALSRALFQRNGNDGNDRREAVDWVRRLMERRDFDPAMMTDTVVDFAKWQIALGNHDVAITELERTLRVDPDDIRANYLLATELLLTAPAKNAREARDADVAAMFGHAYTDEQLTTAGNAAARLGRKQAALNDFHLAIVCNPAYAYAYASRADLLSSMGKRFLPRAIQDYHVAVTLHPRELELTAGLQKVLDAAKRPSDGRRVAVERGYPKR